VRLRICLVLLACLAGLLPSAATPSPARRVAIFFYPWYGTPALDHQWRHWSQNGATPPRMIASNYYPARGVYSSADPSVLRAQMRDIAGAGIDEVVTSWWGRGSPEDARLPQIVEAAHARGLDVALHLEPYPKRTAAEAAKDIRYFQELGIRDVFVYEAAYVPAEDWAPVLAEVTGMRVFAHTRLVGWAKRAGFDGIYTYTNADADDFKRTCAQARAAKLLCAPTVSPGFDARRASNIPRVQPRRDGKTYDLRWRLALCSSPDLVTIASYNEWHEGTQLEPTSARPPGPRGMYRTFDGAYGLHGNAASRAYLMRTKYWVRRFESGRGCRAS
jgi:glycoprotein endo-alpha-1,2-mannosidase